MLNLALNNTHFFFSKKLYYRKCLEMLIFMGDAGRVNKTSVYGYSGLWFKCSAKTTCVNVTH